MEKIQVKSLIILFINVVLMSYLYSCSTSIKTSKYKGPKTQDSVDNTEVKNYLSEITDIPLPSKSEIDLEKTVVVGKQGNWMGRLTLINKNPIDEIFSFFVSFRNLIIYFKCYIYFNKFNMLYYIVKVKH